MVCLATRKQREAAIEGNGRSIMSPPKTHGNLIRLLLLRDTCTISATRMLGGGEIMLGAGKNNPAFLSCADQEARDTNAAYKYSTVNKSYRWGKKSY